MACVVTGMKKDAKIGSLVLAMLQRLRDGPTDQPTDRRVAYKKTHIATLRVRARSIVEKLERALFQFF